MVAGQGIVWWMRIENADEGPAGSEGSSSPQVTLFLKRLTGRTERGINGGGLLEAAGWVTEARFG